MLYILHDFEKHLRKGRAINLHGSAENTTECDIEADVSQKESILIYKHYTHFRFFEMTKFKKEIFEIAFYLFMTGAHEAREELSFGVSR